MPLSFRKLSRYPRNQLLDEDLLRGRAGELDLLGRFGPPTLESPANEPDPTFFWDLEWHCGMVMSLRFNQLTEVLNVRLDEIDIAHALRHIDVDVDDLWTLERDDPGTFAAMGESMDATFELWIETDDGAKAKVAGGLTERDAQCRVAEAEADDPTQRCWVTSVGS